MNIKIRQYAQAIYDLSKENNQTNDYLDLSVALINSFNQNNDLLEYLASGSISFEEKSILIKDITKGYEFYTNWILILIESGKGRYLREYINEYIKIYNEEHNISNGYVWTTELIDQELVNKLEDLISKKLSKEIKLENKINKEIIGGVKLEVGDNVWDNTIKNKLIQLLNKGSEGNE